LRDTSPRGRAGRDDLRGQIEHLYGSLALFVESGDRHVKADHAIQRAIDQLCGRRWQDGSYSPEEQDRILDTASTSSATDAATDGSPHEGRPPNTVFST